MEQNQHIWQSWAQILHRWGVKDLAATFLEALGPLNLVGAQMVYLGQPFLNLLLPQGHSDAFAHMLENPEETRAFVSVLRQSDNYTGA